MMYAVSDARATGEAFLAALQARDFQKLEALFHPKARFRALIPPGLRMEEDAAGAVDHLRRWFGEADHFEIVKSEVGPIGERVHFSYQIHVHDSDGWQVIEQQVYCDVKNGRVEALDLLCSGFLPEPRLAATQNSDKMRK